MYQKCYKHAETSSAVYTRTCARLTHDVSELKHEQTISTAHHVLHMYHKSGLSGICLGVNRLQVWRGDRRVTEYKNIVKFNVPAIKTLPVSELQDEKLHAAEIALFVQQSLRAKKFDQMQIHIHTLQVLIQKHNTSLDQLMSRAALTSPWCC